MVGFCSMLLEICYRFLSSLSSLSSPRKRGFIQMDPRFRGDDRVCTKLHFLCVVLGVCLSFQSFAWNALGHEVIANIAYDHLNPKARETVDQLVSQFSKEYPTFTTFNQLAIWPDKLREQKIESFTHWHYIDFPFSEDGTELKNIADTDNIIWALPLIETPLANVKANPYERARFLAFLTHFIGDIHQPLHTTSRISAKYPNGDQGGNLFYLKYPANDPKTISLHTLWDQGMDLFTGDTSDENINTLAQSITTHFPESYFGTKINDVDPNHWGQEGFTISTTLVYATPEKAVPNEYYLIDAHRMCEERVALAGYRLAKVLNDLLDN